MATYGEDALAVELVHLDVVVVLEVAAVVEPGDGGVGDGLGAARQVDDVVVPGPGLALRRQRERRRKLHRDVAVLGRVAAWNNIIVVVEFTFDIASSREIGEPIRAGGEFQLEIRVLSSTAGFFFRFRAA